MKKSFFTIVVLSSSIIIIIFSVFLQQNLVSFAAKQSQASTSEVTFQKDVSYGSLPKQKLDLCKPATITGKRPGVILIHGGGGDKSDFTSICKQLAEKSVVAIAVNFREDPPPSYIVIHEDNRLALQWLRGRDYVDATKIGAWGGSLGGYESSMLGTYETPEKVQCVNNNYGPTDFTDPNWEGSPMAQEFVDKFFGGVTYEENPQLYQDQSPITHISDGDSQKWLFTRSTNDTLVPRSQMTRMIEALQNAGLQTEFYEYNGTGTGHANRLGPLQARKLLQKRLNFMTNCLTNL